MLQHGKGHHEPSPAAELALAALQLAHGFADNGGAATPILAAGNIVTSVTVTPKVSGRFKLSASVVAHNLTDGGTTVGLQFGHAATADYPASPNDVTLTSAARVSLSLVAENGVDLADYPFVAPLGVPVTFTLIATAGADGTIEAVAHGAQLTVEELPN